ncbi:MAG: hypothetical protein H0U58_09405 [Chloroflexi bacterium]|nr:hypothetical protein [Chloroflexota bacterium]
MFGGSGATAQLVALTLYTDAFIIRGSIETRQRRITDILNGSDEPFLILSDVTTDEFGPSGHTVRAEYAQINLSSTLFAVAHTVIQAIPELRTVKSPLPALISIPPFKISGQIHLLPRDGLRAGLGDLVGRFLPVTDATYWSDSLGEARTSAAIVAVNHARAQILAPHREADPWAGMPAADSVPRELPPDSGW